MSLKSALVVSASLIGLACGSAFAQTPAEPAPQAGAIPVPAAVPATSPAAVTAPVPAANPNAPVTRQELPGLIREAILKDPDMILEAVKILREKQAEEARKKTEEAITKNKNDIFNDPNTPGIGNDRGADVTVVEFFDYHCGYCRTLLPTLVKLYEEDKKVRILFKEMPILSEDSIAASRAALAVHRIAKEKYFDYHTALMKHEGNYDEKALLDIGKKLGVDSQKLKAEMAKPEITAILDANRKLAEELGVRGTPALVVNNTLSPGALPYEELQAIVKKERGGDGKDAASTVVVPPAADKKE